MTDTGNDGISQRLEIKHFGSKVNGDPNEDPYGDGLTNLEENRAGTHAWQADSNIGLEGEPKDANDFRLSFETQVGRHYQLTRGRTPGLPFSNLMVPAIGDGSQHTVMDPMGEVDRTSIVGGRQTGANGGIEIVPCEAKGRLVPCQD